QPGLHSVRMPERVCHGARGTSTGGFRPLLRPVGSRRQQALRLLAAQLGADTGIVVPTAAARSSRQHPPPPTPSVRRCDALASYAVGSRTDAPRGVPLNTLYCYPAR